MYKGIRKEGVEFYTLLTESEKFTSKLGKVTLASAKLEAELIIFLIRNNVKGNFEKAPLGKLIGFAKKYELLEENLIIALTHISKQRNYLTHNIYALFIDLIDETILEKNNLFDSDVHTYIERACQLKENIEGLAEIIKVKNE
jgi:hypothetical protein